MTEDQAAVAIQKRIRGMQERRKVGADAMASIGKRAIIEARIKEKVAGKLKQTAKERWDYRLRMLRRRYQRIAKLVSEQNHSCSTHRSPLHRSPLTTSPLTTHHSGCFITAEARSKRVDAVRPSSHGAGR